MLFEQKWESITPRINNVLIDYLCDKSYFCIAQKGFER
jgi:hypothetical protein